MNKRIIICISREYGSGGRVVGEQLGARLGIPCYDKKMLEKTSRDFGLSQEMIESVDEKPASLSSMGFPMGLRNPFKADFPNALYYVINDRVFAHQAETIRRLAAEGSAIFVGRVSEEVLKNDPDMISVFIHASKESRIQRIMGVEQVNAKNAAVMIQKTDKNRKDYHNFYSDQKWGKCDSYHLSISTSRFGIDGVVEAIARLAAGASSN